VVNNYKIYTKNKYMETKNKSKGEEYLAKRKQDRKLVIFVILMLLAWGLITYAMGRWI